MIKTKHLTTILFALIIMAWAACTQERQPCLTPKSASLIIESIHFKTDTSTLPVDTSLPSAVYYPISIINVPLIYYPPQASFTISLSPDSTVCQWQFSTDTSNYNTKIHDTLTFYYKRNAKFLSNACGFTYFFNIDSVHTTRYSPQTPQFSIDSVHILNTSVTNNVNTKHLQIYIHPDF